MKNKSGYPVKYAVLELCEETRNGKIINGYIASKCYLVESSIVFNDNGTSHEEYKVVFPYNNIEEFKRSIKHNEEYNDIAIMPRRDACNNIYPVSIVDNLYDTLGNASEIAVEKNIRYLNYLESKYNSILNPILKSYYKESISELTKNLEIAKFYEEIVEEKTKDIEVSKTSYKCKIK